VHQLRPKTILDNWSGAWSLLDITVPKERVSICTSPPLQRLPVQVLCASTLNPSFNSVSSSLRKSLRMSMRAKSHAQPFVMVCCTALAPRTPLLALLNEIFARCSNARCPSFPLPSAPEKNAHQPLHPCSHRAAIIYAPPLSPMHVHERAC
jgi:hypothetical protein